MPLALHPRVCGLAPSATLAINERCAALERAGRTVVRLGLGQSPFPVPAPVVAALRRHAHEKAYLPVRGLPALRAAVAAHHGRLDGVDASAEDVLVAPGSKELMFLLQVVLDGELMLPSPAWVSYAPQARILGRRVRWLETRAEDRWRLDPGRLDAACRERAAPPDREGTGAQTRVLMLNHPSNPTGTAYDEDELAALAKVARKHRLIVLSDEIYGRLRHDRRQLAFAPHYPEGTITSSGLSKWCGAGGWRLGVFVFPPALRPLLETMAAVASESYTSTSAPIQHAAVTAFEPSDEIDRYLDASRRVLAALGARCTELLREGGAELVAPEGGFYLFPDVGRHRRALAARGVVTSAVLCERLLEETGVATLPGSDFGRPADELTLRLAYVDFDGTAALAALANGGAVDAGRLDDTFLRRHCGRLLDGVAALGTWLREA